MPRFFDTESRYPRLAIAYRIISSTQTLLFLGVGIYLSLHKTQFISEDGQRFGPTIFFSMAATYAGLWRHIDDTADFIGDFATDAVNQTREYLGFLV